MLITSLISILPQALATQDSLQRRGYLEMTPLEVAALLPARAAQHVIALPKKDRGKTATFALSPLARREAFATARAM